MSDVNWFSLISNGTSSNNYEIFQDKLILSQGNLVLEINLEAVRGLRTLFENLPYLEEIPLGKASDTFKWMVLRKAILKNDPNDTLRTDTCGAGCYIAENNKVGLFLCKIKRGTTIVVEFIAYDYMRDMSFIKSINLQTLLSI